MVISLPQVIDNPFYVDGVLEVDEGLLDEWEHIEETGVGFYEFADKTALLPPVDYFDFIQEFREENGLPPVPIDEICEEDYFGIRDLLNYAARLRALSVRGNVTEDDLKQCGITPKRWDRKVLDSYGLSGLSYNGAEAKVPIRGRAYIRYLAGLATGHIEVTQSQHFDIRAGMRIEDALHDPNFSERFKLENYLKEQHFASPDHRFAYEDGRFWYCMEAHARWSGADDDAVGCFDHLPGAVLDLLCELHLKEIETVTRDGVPYQAARWGVCALWLAFCNRFTRSRITTCEACGRPILVTEERGTQRKYCNERCRSWKKRHPNETRGLRTSLKEGR